MPKRAKPRSTDVSLSYLNNVNAESKRRRTVNEPSIYGLPTSPEPPQDTRKVRHARLSEPATRFRTLRNRHQVGGDPSQQGATPRSPSNEEQESPNDAQSEPDDNQSAESENIDESTGSHAAQNETGNIGEHQADNSDERQPTPPEPAIHPSIEDLFLPKGAQEEGQESRNSGFVSINGPQRVISRNSRSRPRASDLFPAKLPETTGAQNDGDEDSSPASVDGYFHGNHSGSESVESNISEEIVKEGPDSDENSVGEGEEEDEPDEENPIHHFVNLFSDEAELEAQDGPDEDASEEFHSPIPAQHPASKSLVEVQVPIHTNGSRRYGTRRNQAGPNISLSSQNEYRNQVPETPAQPRRRRGDRATRKADAADQTTASSTPNRRPSPVLVEDHEVRLGIFSWLNDTVKESGFKEDWQIICRPRRVLKLRADSSMKDRFTGSSKLILRLHDLYKIMAREPYSANSSMTSRCRLIANSIFNEGQLVLVEEAPEYENEATGGHLVNQFEAHIVPDLIKLLIVAFKTYKTVGDGAKPHLLIALDLLWATCHRISSIQDVDDRIGPLVLATSHEVLSHIKVVKDALNDGRLHERLNLANRVPRRYKHFELTEVQSNITCDPWTGSEKLALLEGLNGFNDDEDTLVDLKCDMRYGPALERRTLKDLQAQAQRLGL